MTQKLATIKRVRKEDLKFCNSRTIHIDVVIKSDPDNKLIAVSMGCTPSTPYSERQNFEWFWDNAEEDCSCTLLQKDDYDCILLPIQ